MRAWLGRTLRAVAGKGGGSGAGSGGGIGSSGPLFVANMLEAVLPFLRNIALVRLIAPDAFGLASRCRW